MKARVSTIGPEEHIIVPENPSDASAKEWVVYDVGGSRSQRGKLFLLVETYPVFIQTLTAAWAQFFDDGESACAISSTPFS